MTDALPQTLATQVTPVTLVAPVASWRGGIARHSGMLARALAAMPDVDLSLEGFARLYPRRLYPGTDPRAERSGEWGAFELREDLDTLDPRSWHQVARRIIARGGIAVFPAWTFFTAPCLGWIARKVRSHGVKTIAVVHNVADHEGAWWKATLMKWQLSSFDQAVTHGQELAAELTQAGFTGPVSVVPHPPFSDFPQATGRLPREHALELLCFGLVRHYKGVDIALDALEAAGLEDVRLTIVGEIWGDASDIRERAAGMAQVELVDRYVSDVEAADYFIRADAVLLPYRTVTGSGVLALARHYRRPVVASNLPALSREIHADRLGWTFAAHDVAALGALLRAEVDRARTAAVSAAMPDPADASAAGWSAMARAILQSTDPA